MLKKLLIILMIAVLCTACTENIELQEAVPAAGVRHATEGTGAPSETQEADPLPTRINFYCTNGYFYYGTIPGGVIILMLEDEQGIELFMNLINNAEQMPVTANVTNPLCGVDMVYYGFNRSINFWINSDSNSGMYSDITNNHTRYSFRSKDVKAFLNIYGEALTSRGEPETPPVTTARAGQSEPTCTNCSEVIFFHSCCELKCYNWQACPCIAMMEMPMPCPDCGACWERSCVCEPSQIPPLVSLSAARSRQILESYADYLVGIWDMEQVLTADDLMIIYYFGTYNGNEVVVIYPRDWGATADMQYISILSDDGEITIALGSGSYELMVHNNGTFYEITTAHRNGLLTMDDIRHIAYYSSNG